MDHSRYSFRFERQGYCVESDVPENVVYIDVGNRLSPGVIDHHHMVSMISEEAQLSSSVLIVRCRHFIPKDLRVIVTHEYPDMDSWLAVYLAIYFHQNNSLPKRYEFLTSFANAYDNGKLNYSLSGSNEVIGLINMLQYMTISDDDLHFAILCRGLKLVELLFESINKVPDLSDDETISWEQIDLTEIKRYFSNEFNALKTDYDVYKSELENSDIIEVKKVNVLNQVTGEIEAVNGMIWNNVPACRLHKHWARCEMSYDGEIVATFIPMNCDLSDIGGVSPTRVIISVDPNSPYSLAGLAEQLDAIECRKEKFLFSEKLELVRANSGKPVRFIEGWCNSDDPWYDGRSHNYTIVDTPRRGSILSQNEIESAFLRYLDNKIHHGIVRHVFSFNFRKSAQAIDFKGFAQGLLQFKPLDIGKAFGAHGCTEELYSHINNYFMNSSNESIRAFELLDDEFLKQMKAEYRKVQEAVGMDHTVVVAVEKTSLLIFKYGIGYIINEVKVQDSEGWIPGEDYIRFDEALTHHYQAFTGICEKRFRIMDDYRVRFNYVYSLHNLMLSGFGSTLKSKAELIDTLINRRTHVSNAAYEGPRLQTIVSKIEAVDKEIFHDSGKNGYALLWEKGNEGEVTENGIESLFEMQFMVFLFAVHQRDCLLNFSQRLANFASSRKGISALSQLQHEFMDFMTQGWFSEISVNSSIDGIYKKWSRALSTSSLYDEVNAQLKSFNEYIHSLRGKKISFLGSLLIPLTMVTTLYNNDIVKYLLRDVGNVQFYMVITCILIAPAIYWFLDNTPRVR